jgi:acetyl-CoA carboxylase alpha subunit
MSVLMYAQIFKITQRILKQLSLIDRVIQEEGLYL